MKKLILLLVLALPFQAHAVNDIFAHSSGTVTGADGLLLEKADRSVQYYATLTSLQDLMQSGVVQSSGTLTIGGDAAGSGTFGSGSVSITLATVNSNTGTFTDPTVVVNGKGLITSISSNTRVNSLIAATSTLTGSITIALTNSGSGSATMTANSGTITLNVPTPASFTLTPANTGTLGGVKVDGSTIVADGGGVISIGTDSIGISLLSATGSPSSSTFLRGDNTWAAPGGVTSVALAVPSILSVSGTPVTSSGTLTIGLANESANTVLAGPASGSATTPTFRALASADIPNNAANTTGSAGSVTGTVGVANGGTGTTTFTSYGVVIGGTTSTGPLQSVATGTAGFVLTSNGSGAAPSMKALTAAGITINISSGFTATANTTYASGVVPSTCTLPSSPTDGQWVRIIDPFGGSATGFGAGGFGAGSPLTISTTGTINYPGGSGTSYVANWNYQDILLVYDNSATAWELREDHPIQSSTGTLTSGSATKTVPSGTTQIWVNDTSSSPGAIGVSVAGTAATIKGTGTNTFNLLYH